MGNKVNQNQSLSNSNGSNNNNVNDNNSNLNKTYNFADNSSVLNIAENSNDISKSPEKKKGGFMSKLKNKMGILKKDNNEIHKIKEEEEPVDEFKIDKIILYKQVNEEINNIVDFNLDYNERFSLHPNKPDSNIKRKRGSVYYFDKIDIKLPISTKNYLINCPQIIKLETQYTELSKLCINHHTCVKQDIYNIIDEPDNKENEGNDNKKNDQNNEEIIETDNLNENRF